MDLPGRTNNMYKGRQGETLRGIAESQEPMPESFTMCRDQPAAQDGGCFGATGFHGDLIPPRFIQYDLRVEELLRMSPGAPRVKSDWDWFQWVLIIMILVVLFKLLRGR